MSEILVIEDNEDIRQATLEFLEMENFRVLGYENGLKALQYLSDSSNTLPKLIIADLSMPVMDGTEFRKQQLAHERLRDLPMVIMSADAKISEKCKELGIHRILRKPIDLDDLLIVANEFVRN